MSISRFFVIFLLILLCGSGFSVFLLSSAQVDSSVLSMSGSGWSVKVDSSLQTVLDSKAVPYVSVQKSGSEKELFLTLNSLKDCVAGQIQFKVQTQGLTIFKQLALDKELSVGEQYDFVNATHAMMKGQTLVYRPLNVVDSFAGFDSNGRKVIHIYRSMLVDAKGNSVWVDSSLENGLLTVYLDQKWLADAVFPVVVDPVFGYTNIGASWGLVDGDNYANVFTSPVNGEVSKISAYLKVTSGTASIELGIYNGSSAVPLNKLDSGSVTGITDTVGNWVNVTVNVETTIYHDYWLAWSGSAIYIAKDSTAELRSIDFGAPLPSVWSADSTNGEYSASIFATYTEITSTPTPSPSPSPSPIPSSVEITDGELSFSFLFVLGFMVIASIISLMWFGRVPVVPLVVGLFTFLVGLYAGLGGVYSLGVVQGWFSLFVALFGGLTMLLVGLGVRVKR